MVELVSKPDGSCADSRTVDTVPYEDPMLLFSDVLTKVRTLWMRLTYPFAHFGRGVSIHYSCEIFRSASNRIHIGDSVYIATGTWMTVPESGIEPAIVIGDGCKIGRRCMISAKNCVVLEDNVMLGPAVLLTDHSHEFSNPEVPVHRQGLTAGGSVRVESGCWLGHGAAIVGASTEVVLGRNSIVGANSVVTRSIPPFSVVAGNPARVIRRYDPGTRNWTRQELPRF